MVRFVLVVEARSTKDMSRTATFRLNKRDTLRRVMSRGDPRQSWHVVHGGGEVNLGDGWRF